MKASELQQISGLVYTIARIDRNMETLRRIIDGSEEFPSQNLAHSMQSYVPTKDIARFALPYLTVEREKTNLSLLALGVEFDLTAEDELY